jgi:hypothetical protein
MQERCRRAQVHFWPIAIEVEGHCPASFLKFAPNVCNAAKELTEQNPQAPQKHWWKRVACELHQANAKPALQRAAAARRALFRLPLVLMTNCKTTSCKPICLLKSPIAVRIVTANGIPETPGPPASARGTPSNDRGSWRALYCRF